MARKAIKDTFATIAVGGGVEQRVRVFAGHVVPNSYQMEEGSYEEVEGGVQSFGQVEQPPDKPAPEPEPEEEDVAPTPARSSRRRKGSGAS